MHRLDSRPGLADYAGSQRKPEEDPEMAMARVNRQWVLRQRPKGLIRPGDLELVEGPVPALKESQVLVRTVYLSLDRLRRSDRSDREIKAAFEAAVRASI